MALVYVTIGFGLGMGLYSLLYRDMKEDYQQRLDTNEEYQGRLRNEVKLLNSRLQDQKKVYHEKTKDKVKQIREILDEWK